MPDINVLYYSCPFDLSGYGTVSRNHLLKMMQIKTLNVRLRSKRFWTGVSPDLKEDGDRLHQLERNSLPDNEFIFIQHLTPENFYIDPRAMKHVCYTPFETDGAPSSWLLPLKAMDEIWVPSEYNKQAYIRAGLKKDNIFVIPHGVDTTRYNLSVVPLEYNRGKFNFGSVFDWSERKNPIALIRAYYNAFFSGEDVTLTIRTFWRFPIEATKEYVTGEIEKIKRGYSGRTEFPKILFWFDTMSEVVMPNFYKSFDCFVLPTRGEGFGLPFAEAMACGVPVIGPSIGGNTEFMNEDNSILVKGKIVPIKNSEFLMRHSQYANQKWFDIDEIELSKAMRRCHDHRDEAEKIGFKGSEYIKNLFTWDVTAGKILRRLLEIKGTN